MIKRAQREINLSFSRLQTEFHTKTGPKALQSWLAVFLALVSSSCFCSVCGSAAMGSDCCFLASSSDPLSHFKRLVLASSYLLYLSTTSLRLLPS